MNVCLAFYMENSFCLKVTYEHEPNKIKAYRQLPLKTFMLSFSLNREANLKKKMAPYSHFCEVPSTWIPVAYFGI